MKKIIHIDMDAFYASVEMRDNLALRNIPMAVGGSSQRRGVISTANYHARKFGVRSAMPTAHALKLCPQLVVVKTRMHKYVEASRQVFEILRQYTDLVEPMSMDEAYLDVTDSPFCHNSATLIAQEIRQKIFEKTQLTASAGIAPNKLIAKMASDYKKPNGQFTVAPHEIEKFIETVPVERIWGIGKVTAKRLHDQGLRTCLDLQALSRVEMSHMFGKFGENLYGYCRGIDHRNVETEFERKSLGTEETFSKDIDDLEEMKSKVKVMVQEVQESLERYEDRTLKNLHIKIKYHDFKRTTIERQLPFGEQNFLTLLEERWLQDPRPVRLLGVGVKFEETIKEARYSGDQLQLLTDLESLG